MKGRGHGAGARTLRSSCPARLGVASEAMAMVSDAGAIAGCHVAGVLDGLL